jgi:leucyl-tRNA synthetase
LKETIVDFLKLLAPFAPHFTEEQWNLLGNTSTFFNEKWPEFNPSALIKDEVEIAIQINGKIKAKINVPSNLDEEGIKAASLENETIKELAEGKTIAKVIVIKGRLVNIVVK